MIAKGYTEFDLFSMDREIEYRYIDYEDGVKVVGYSGLKEYLEIPECLDGKKVVAIGVNSEGYPGCRCFKLLLPNTVRFIDAKCNPMSEKSWISDLFFRDDNESFFIEDKVLYSKDKKILYFGFNDDVDSLVIPEGVEYIGEYAFANQNFKFISIPASVKYIGSYAFSSGYQSIEIPETVEKIGDYIARYYSLTGDNKAYKIVDGCVYTLDGKILVQCVQKGISQIVIPDSVEEIRPYAFYEKTITKLDLGSGVKTIGEKAFADAEVKTIRIPNQLVELADNAFGYLKCNSVRVGKENGNFYSDGINFYKINQKGEKRLLKCFKSKEEECFVPEGVTSIAPGAFGDCTSMKRLDFPASLERFDESCLVSSCYGNTCAVKKIDIPENVAQLSVSFDKFLFNISKDNRMYFIEEGILYHRIDDSLEIVAARGVSGELVIKNGVTKIKAYAFANCKKLSKIVCNKELRVIEHNAFSNGWENNQIKEVLLNEGLEYIDYLAFSRSKVEKIFVPASVQYICISAFHACENAEFEVSEENVFYNSVDGALYDKDMTEIKFVPKSKVYTKYVVPSGVTEIGCAFRGCKKIKEIVIPSTVGCIWRDALACKVKNIYFEGDIRSFDYAGIDFWENVKIYADAGTGAAQYVEWLKESRGDVKVRLVINGAEDISALTKDFEVMLNDTGITIVKLLKEKKTVIIPEKIGNYNVTKIASRAFEWDYSGENIVEEVIIPDTVKEIGDNTFLYRNNLKKVILPKGLKKISMAMFAFCDSLQEIDIPEGVVEICDSAFFGCQNLLKIIFPVSIEKISDWFMANEDGNDKDLFLAESTVYVVEKGSYSEKFLRAYKTDSTECKKLVVLYNDQVSGKITEEQNEILEYLKYKISEDGTATVRFKSYWEEEHPNVKIPSMIQGIPVTKLAGMGNIPNSMETLYIPEGVTTIQGLNRYSFSDGGMDMKKIDVAENNPSYWSDGRALYTKDKSVLIHMFDYQTEEYEVCSSTKVIESGAFGSFSNLRKLILPNGLHEIRKEAFYDCFNLEEIVGVEKVQIIEKNVLSCTAYYDKCSILFNGTVLQKYNAIGEKQYTIPEGTTEIANQAFLYGTEDYEDVLEEIVVPDSVTVIGASAFQGRKKLHSVNIPNGVKKIEVDTFKRCVSLKKLYIPSSVCEISENAFPVYEQLWRGPSIVPIFSEIEVAAENNTYKSIDGILYSKDGQILISVPSNFSKEEFVVPEAVKIIGPNAFMNNKNIKKIVLLDNVKVISRAAFYKCDNLESINLENIEIIEDSAFAECINLKNICINVEKIGNYAFSSCKNIKKITLQKTKIIGQNAFEYTGITQIDFPMGIEEIGERAFARCNLKEVTIPKTVIKMGNECFSGCSKITIYDTFDPEAKPCTEHLDNINGYPNSIAGFIGIGSSYAMWECAANHSWIDHEIIVRSAESDEIKFKVWMGADPSQRKYYCTLTSSWGKNASFNFLALDEAFAGIKGVDHKIRVALNRLRYPVMLSDTYKSSYVAYLVRSAKDLIKMCIDYDDMETLMFCEPFGVIKKNNIDDMLEYAAQNKAIQFSAYFIEYKNKNFAGSKKKTKELSL